MATIDALKARRINWPTKEAYFGRFISITLKSLKESFFVDDPYVFNYAIPKDACKKDVCKAAEYLQKQAIMNLNRYPGNIQKLNPDPPPGMYNQSAFIKRLKIGEKEFIETTPEKTSRKIFPEHLVKETELRILNGEMLMELMAGGQAKRLELGEKFILSPQDLFGSYVKFFAEKEEKSKVSGREHGLISPQNIHLTPGLQTEETNLLGVRRMLAFAHTIKELADKHGLNWQEALYKQTLFIIANEKIIHDILDLFKTFSFFGLDSDKTFFMVTENYDSLNFSLGTQQSLNLLRTKEKENDFIHNHGAARIETTADDKWFTIKNGKREYHSSEKIQEIYARHSNLQSQPIEDLNSLLTAFDTRSVTLALYGSQIIETDEKFNMTMDVVGQKKPPQIPQKGGVLVYDPEFIGEFTGRLAMVEAFQTFPRFVHYIDKVAEECYADIKWLNLNQNNYPNPVVLYKAMKQEGLPVWWELKNGGFRNESPQGDANYFLPTLYIARTVMNKTIKNEEEELPVVILNLKEKNDIPTALFALQAQATLKGMPELTGQFILRGFWQNAVDYSFKELSNTAKDPIDVKAVLAHPFLKTKLEAKFLNILENLAKTDNNGEPLFKVEGSMVYDCKIEIEEENTANPNVSLQVLSSSIKGTAQKYPSRAFEKRILAQDVKRLVFLEQRVWSDYKEEGGFSYVLVSNRQKDSQTGEVVLLLGNYNENFPSTEKPIILSQKLNLLINRITARRPLILPGQIIEEFKKLPWKFLFNNDTPAIEKALEEILR